MLTIIKCDGKPKEIVRCPRCNGSVFMDARHTLRRDGKRMTAGHKAKICAACMANGELTLI